MRNPQKGFALLAVLSVMFLRASLRPALKAAEAEATGFPKRMIASWTSGWRGDEAEREASANRLRVLAPIICLAYAFGFSLIAFDQVKNLGGQHKKTSIDHPAIATRLFHKTGVRNYIME